MENFMDKLYSKISVGSNQSYVSDLDHRKKALNENRMEAISNLIRENDSKQLECIAAIIGQESEERQLSKAELLNEIQSVGKVVQKMDFSLQDAATTLKQLQTEQSFEPEPATVSNDMSEEKLQGLEEHIHKENVKCYRNVQASVMEQAELQMEETRISVRPVKGMLIALIILSLANMGVLVVHILGFI